MEKAIFWDRDGVLNYAADDGSPRTFDKFKIVEHMKETLALTRKLGYLNVVVTNQPDIARGKMTQEDLERMTAELWVQLPIDAVYICPHDNADNCICRKPKPGLIHQAAEELGIDLFQSIIVGDHTRDFQTAQAAGIPVLMQETKYDE